MVPIVRRGRGGVVVKYHGAGRSIFAGCTKISPPAFAEPQPAKLRCRPSSVYTLRDC